ncbi:MAG: pre-peptidase C-terminal domain-containing protein, partial [Pseudomonadota bacterium]
MCVICAANPIAAFDGTHAGMQGYFEKAGDPQQEVLQSIETSEAVGEIEVGGSISSTLVPGGAEVFRMDLDSDETVTIDLFGAGIDQIDDTVLSIYDADGNLIGSNDDIVLGQDGDSRLTFTAKDAGEIFIRVEGHDSQEDAGSYQLQVATASAGNIGTLDQMAKQLYDDYWSQDFKWNLGSDGYMAKNGTLTFNISGHSGDSNGLGADRKDLVREAFKIYEEVLGINFVETTDASADFRFSDNKSGAYAG